MIVGIITARGGSKRIPRKNILKLAGKPLISYIITEAKRSSLLDRVIVSTDDEEIAKVSKEYGAEVMMRPKELSEDKTPTLPVIKHVVERIRDEGDDPEIVVILQPTSPLCLAEDIDSCISQLKTGERNSVVSARKLEINPYGIMELVQGKTRFFIKERPAAHPRKQEIPDLYRFNGAVWAVKTKILMKQEHHVIDPDNNGIFVMPADRSIDIDESEDFILAEELIKRRKR